MSKTTLSGKSTRRETGAPQPLLAGAANVPLSGGGRAREIALRFGMVWALLGLGVVAVVVYPQFLTVGNINNLVGQIAPVGIAAIGATVVILAGGIDLSVTAVAAGSSVVFAMLSNQMPIGWAILTTLLVAAIAGLFNGLVIMVLKINDLIATLATGSLFSGAAYFLSNSAPITASDPDFTVLGSGKVGGIWISSFVLVGLLVVVGVILAKTVYGRAIYAVGGNREASRLAGLRTSRLRVSTFIISSACAGLAGMILASQTGVGQANIAPTMTLDAIAIVVVGGTSLFGGEGAMWRTAIGILIWGTISNLFNALALSTYAQLLTQGGILLAALALDSLTRRQRR